MRRTLTVLCVVTNLSPFRSGGFPANEGPRPAPLPRRQLSWFADIGQVPAAQGLLLLSAGQKGSNVVDKGVGSPVCSMSAKAQQLSEEVN
jgi:hypothetical protein